MLASHREFESLSLFVCNAMMDGANFVYCVGPRQGMNYPQGILYAFLFIFPLPLIILFIVISSELE